MIRNLSLLILFGLLGSTGIGIEPAAAEPRELSELELAGVVAGTVEVAKSDGQLTGFRYLGETNAGRRVAIEGSIQPLQNTITNNITGMIELSGGAQSNLSSLVNINAVNSQVQVLLNLNITIDSKVGSVSQTNQVLGSQWHPSDLVPR